MKHVDRRHFFVRECVWRNTRCVFHTLQPATIWPTFSLNLNHLTYSSGCGTLSCTSLDDCTRVREGVVVHWAIYSRPILPTYIRTCMRASRVTPRVVGWYKLSRESELWAPPRTPRSSSSPRNTTKAAIHEATAEPHQHVHRSLGLFNPNIGSDIDWKGSFLSEFERTPKHDHLCRECRLQSRTRRARECPRSHINCHINTVRAETLTITITTTM